MTDQEDRRKEILNSEGNKLTRETWEQLKAYAFQAFVSLAIFGIFVGVSIGVELVARAVEQFGIVFGIALRIVAWTVSACGVTCCIVFIVMNTIDFIQFLRRRHSQEASIPDVAGGGRGE